MLQTTKNGTIIPISINLLLHMEQAPQLKDDESGKLLIYAQESIIHSRIYLPLQFDACCFMAC
jgi:hypothetical protein